MLAAPTLLETPPGWEAEGDGLIRVADPSGQAIAWLAPTYGANCIAYAVWRRSRWVQVFHVEEPQALKVRPTRSGCAVLFPFPGHVRDARYRWAGETFDLPPNVPNRQHYTHGFARFWPWRVVRMGAVASQGSYATLELAAGTQVGYPFNIQLRLQFGFINTALTFVLEATNVGERTAPVGLGLHPYFAPALFGADRTAVRVELPGRLEHLLADDVPTGERRRVTVADVVPPPIGETLLIARTDLGVHPVTLLHGVRGSTLRLVTSGSRDLLLYAPADRPSFALEPHSCAPSAASQPQGHPDGLVGLAPGKTMRLSMSLSVQSTSAA